MLDYSRRFNCFFLSKQEKPIYEKNIRLGGYYLSVDTQTLLDIGEKDGRSAVVFGDAVNVISGKSSGIAQWLLDGSKDIDSLINLEKELGGQYVIFYAEGGESIFVLGDAMCSIPVFYSPDNFCCANSPERIAKAFGLKADPSLVEIKDNTSDKKRILPGDITIYREILMLLPNHYWDVKNRKAVRFVNSDREQEAISAENAAELTHPMIMRLAEYYYNKYQLMCPVTAGRDSRVVLAYLSKVSGNTVNGYILRHMGFTDDSDMIRIPKALCDIVKIDFTAFDDVELSPEWNERMDDLLGKNCYSKRLAEVSCTMGFHLGDFAGVNGDIIGQIGKSSIHRTLPETAASAKYFTKRLHNFSANCPAIVEQWMRDVEDSGEKVDIFDLFSVENRLARMFGVNNMMHSETGQKYLNIFNSRSIIYCWTAVSREERISDEIHRELLKRTVPEFLDVPYEGKPLSDRILKKNDFLFRTSISVGYFVDKLKHRR